MSDETCSRKQKKRRYFSDKGFDYLQLDSAFYEFANNCSVDAEVILRSIEDAISTRHHDAVLDADWKGIYKLWMLETDAFSFCYQVQPVRVVIGCIYCKVTKEWYEAIEEPMADFD